VGVEAQEMALVEFFHLELLQHWCIKLQVLVVLELILEQHLMVAV